MTEEYISDSMGVLCTICRSVLSSVETAFCPSCGHAVFKNAVFYNKSKSTSQYDPFGRYSKPWKDKPLVKTRKYASSKEKSVPWIPTMRQPRRPRRDVPKLTITKVIKSSNLEEDPLGSAEDDASLPMTDHAITLSMDDAPKTSQNIATAPAVKEEISKVTILEKHIARDRLYPLVAYDLSTDKENFTLFISLLESTFADSSTKVYWLKLALLIGNDDHFQNTGHEAEDQTTSQKLWTLGYFSNAIGRLTIPNSEDWVELSSIDAKEHYMAQFMQKVLCYICPLIKYREDLSMDGDLLYDVTIRNLSQAKQFQEVESVDDFGRSHLSRQTLQILCKCHGVAANQFTHPFCVDDRVATFNCRLRLTRSAYFPFCPVQVHVRVEYRDCPSINPQIQQRCVHRSEFLESIRATHLILRIQPDIASLKLSTYIPIATFTFDKLVLMQLLKREPELHDIIEAACEDLSVLENYVTRLVNMLRLENTEGGSRYSLAGSFLDPTFISFPWPEDIEIQLSNYAMIDNDDHQPTPPDTTNNDTSNLPQTPPPPTPLINEVEIISEELNEENGLIRKSTAPQSNNEIIPNISSLEGKEDGLTPPRFVCPVHMVDDCACHQSNLTLRGTPLRLFVDFGSVLIDWSSEDNFRRSWDDVEELYVSVIDISGENPQGYFKDEHYVKGKVCILPVRKSVIDSVIEEFAWSFEDPSPDSPSTNHQMMEETFIATLTNHFDLFKSDSHHLLKLSAK